MGSLRNSEPGANPVVISASDAREISRLLKLLQSSERPRINDNYLQDIAKDSQSFARAPRAKLIVRAQALFAERKRRAKYLSRAMFGEPAWDLLLCLYIMDGRRVTFGKLVNMIGEPMSTAVRWMDYLEKEHLVARKADPNDRRVVCLELLERGRETLDSYFNSFTDDAAFG